MLIDDMQAMIGTANLDNRSFRLNFEISALITDEKFAQEIQTMLENDLKKALLITTAELEQKSFIFKLSTHLARLTSPVL